MKLYEKTVKVDINFIFARWAMCLTRDISNRVNDSSIRLADGSKVFEQGTFWHKPRVSISIRSKVIEKNIKIDFRAKGRNYSAKLDQKLINLCHDDFLSSVKISSKLVHPIKSYAVYIHTYIVRYSSDHNSLPAATLTMMSDYNPAL